MIPVSMSRKDPSFAQLTSYMQDAEKSPREYDLHYNCLSRDKRHIAGEFYANSQHLKKHKARNTLYHEIISISLEEGVDKKYAKDSLREIADKWVDMRCPNNMVYGCLHEDHEKHLHYHLMISANEIGQSNRLRLTKPEFQQVKHDHEAYVLQQYPELKQRAINTLSQNERSQSRKATAQQRRTGKLEQRDLVRDKVVQSMLNTNSLADFHENLAGHNMEYYQRGKNHGVVETQADGSEKKYRFSTIGVHETYEEFASVMEAVENAQEEPEQAKAEKENAHGHDDQRDPQQSVNSAEQDERKDKKADQNFGGEKEKEDRENPKEARRETHDEARGGAKDKFTQSKEKQHKPDKEPRNNTQKDDQSAQEDSHESSKEAPPQSEFLDEMRDRRAKRQDKKREKALKAEQGKSHKKGRTPKR